MFRHSLVADSIAFWGEHQNVLDELRANVKSKKPCRFCDRVTGGPTTLVRVNGSEKRLLCACVVVDMEIEQAAKYRDFTNLPAQARLTSFATIKRPGDASDKQWASMQAAIASLESLKKSPRRHKWVYIPGIPGNGKTTLLLAAYNSISHVAIYTLVPNLAHQFHEGLKREGERPEEWMELNQLIRTLVDVPVLLMDDLGAEHEGPFVTNMLTDIIIERYEYGLERPTVVTTNLTLAEMDLRYRRVASRLSDEAFVEFRPIFLPDHRRRKDTDGKRKA